jgi:hypothetical protein
MIGCIGLLPGTIAFVSVGTTLGSLADTSSASLTKNKGLLVFAIVGTLIALICSIYISYLAKKEINRILNKNPVNSEAQQDLAPNGTSPVPAAAHP